MTGKAMILDWKAMAEGREKYNAYLASPEWSALKRAVHQRSGGICERCHHAAGSEVHHQTYIRKYRETLADLLHVCRPCHAYINNPELPDPCDLYRAPAAENEFTVVSGFEGEKGYVQCPRCCGEVDDIHLQSVVVYGKDTVIDVRRDHADVRQYRGDRDRNGDPVGRRGSVVQIHMFCECGYTFLWHLQFHKGSTWIEVPIGQVEQEPYHEGELWRN